MCISMCNVVTDGRIVEANTTDYHSALCVYVWLVPNQTGVSNCQLVEKICDAGQLVASLTCEIFPI